MSLLLLFDGAGVVSDPGLLVPGDRPRVDTPFQVILGNHDVTPLLGDQISFSNVDPGGFEAASLTFTEQVQAPRGTPVRIFAGLATVFMGRVAEGQPVFSTSIQCEGAGAALKDGRMQEIYIDRDLGRWRGPSAQRRLDLGAGDAYNPINDPQSSWDTETGSPALRLEISGHMPGTTGALAEGWYDGGDVLIAGLIVGSDTGQNYTNVNFALVQATADTDTATGIASTTLVNGGAAVSTVYRAFDTAKRWAVLRWIWSGGAFTADEDERWRNAKQLAVIGNHGLTLRGTTGAEGLYPDDIAKDALSRIPGIQQGIIEPASGLIVPHATYPDPTPHEQPIDDMAKLVGFHWGVWEPLSLFDTVPRLDFRAPPTLPTAFCGQADMLDNPDLSERLSDLYDTVQVSWTDTAGARNVTERTAAIPELADVGLSGRVLSVDLGLGTAASAETFGDYVLGLQQGQARAAGSVTLGGTVGTGAGRMPAFLLRAGLDRLAITDLTSNAPMLTANRTSFHVRRVEVTAGRQGVRTTVELDNGANLIDVLVAQLQLSTQTAV